MSDKSKFEFFLEEDQGYILHNDSPKCKAKMGDDDDLIDEYEWLEDATEEQKEQVKKEMFDWYHFVFNDMKHPPSFYKK